jgi:hypothetical protein
MEIRHETTYLQTRGTMPGRELLTGSPIAGWTIPASCFYIPDIKELQDALTHALQLTVCPTSERTTEPGGRGGPYAQTGYASSESAETLTRRPPSITARLAGKANPDDDPRDWMLVRPGPFVSMLTSRAPGPGISIMCYSLTHQELAELERVLSYLMAPDVRARYEHNQEAL